MAAQLEAEELAAKDAEMDEADFIHLTDIPLARTNFNPVQAASSAIGRELWARYDAGEYELDVGQDDLDLNPDSATRSRLENEADEFGLWNTDTLAHELGIEGLSQDQALLDFEVEDRLAELLDDLSAYEI